MSDEEKSQGESGIRMTRSVRAEATVEIEITYAALLDLLARAGYYMVPPTADVAICFAGAEVPALIVRWTETTVGKTEIEPRTRAPKRDRESVLARIKERIRSKVVEDDYTPEEALEGALRYAHTNGVCLTYEERAELLALARGSTAPLTNG